MALRRLRRPLRLQRAPVSFVTSDSPSRLQSPLLLGFINPVLAIFAQLTMLALRVASRTGLRPASSTKWPVSSFPKPIRRIHGLAQSKFFKVSEEIRDAVATGKPVVALETTIYTHGMYESYPFPRNSSTHGIIRIPIP